MILNIMTIKTIIILMMSFTNHADLFISLIRASVY